MHNPIHIKIITVGGGNLIRNQPNQSKSRKTMINEALCKNPG